MEKLFAAHTSHQHGDSFMQNIFDVVRLLRSAGSALSAQAALHSQLIKVEWEAEKNRIAQLVTFGLVALACVICLLLSITILTIGLSWDSPYRIHVLIAQPVVYTLALFWIWRRIKVLMELGSRTFAATREELAADLALIKSRL